MFLRSVLLPSSGYPENEGSRLLGNFSTCLLRYSEIHRLGIHHYEHLIFHSVCCFTGLLILSPQL
jgi:hypothetical protein